MVRTFFFAKKIGSLQTLGLQSTIKPIWELFRRNCVVFINMRAYFSDDLDKCMIPRINSVADIGSDSIKNGKLYNCIKGNRLIFKFQYRALCPVRSPSDFLRILQCGIHIYKIHLFNTYPLKQLIELLQKRRVGHCS